GTQYYAQRATDTLVPNGDGNFPSQVLLDLPVLLGARALFVRQRAQVGDRGFATTWLHQSKLRLGGSFSKFGSQTNLQMMRLTKLTEHIYDDRIELERHDLLGLTRLTRVRLLARGPTRSRVRSPAGSGFGRRRTQHFRSQHESSNPTSDQDNCSSGNAQDETQFGLLLLGFCVFVGVVGHWCGYSQLPMYVRTKRTIA